MNKITVDKIKKCLVLIEHLPIEALDDLLQSLEELTDFYSDTAIANARNQNTGIRKNEEIFTQGKYPPPIVIEPLWRLENDLR